MLSISRSRKAGTEAGYYLNYYSNHGLDQGIWFAEGADLLEMPAKVRKKEFTNLLFGFSPNGKRAFFKNSGDPNRAAFNDLTFTAPKPFSVLYENSTDEQKAALDQRLYQALFTTLEYAEEHFGLTRRGAAGLKWEKAALTFAVFRHRYTRANEPGIHFHCLLMNAGIAKDGFVGTLQTRPLFQAKIMLGTFFSHELARLLKTELSLPIQEREIGFGIEGVSDSLCDKLSTRSKEIKAYMKKHGLKGAKLAKIAAEETRQKKKHQNEEILQNQWQKVSADFGLTKEVVESIFSKKTPRLDPHAAGKSSEPTQDEEVKNERAHEKRMPEGEKQHFAKSEEKNRQTEQRVTNETTKEKKDSTSKEDEKKKEHFHHEEKKERWENAQENTKTTSGSKKEQKKKKRPTFDRKSKKSAQKGSSKEENGYKAFKAELKKASNWIYVEERTKERVSKLAFKIAKRYDVTAEEVLRAVKELKLPILKKFYRVEWHQAFKKAPEWSPASKIYLPRVAIVRPKRKWGKIYGSLAIPAITGAKFEVRLQQRYIFPQCPKWNPAWKLSVRAPRIAPVRKFGPEKIPLREKHI